MKTRKNQCEDMLELFSLHLDDELDEVGHKRVQRHQASCANCAHVFSELRHMDLLLKQAPMKCAPIDFTEKVVTAAFDAELRRNLLIGFVILMLGTIIISSIVILGRIDLIWMSLSILFAPGFISGSQIWLTEFMEAITVAGRAGLGLLNLIRELLIGPLLIPSLMSLLSAVFVIFFLRRTGQPQPVPVTS